LFRNFGVRAVVGSRLVGADVTYSLLSANPMPIADPTTWWTFVKEAPTLAFLLWFMFVVFPRLKGMESAIDRLSRTVLCVIVALPQILPSTKRAMEEIIHEIDDAESRRSPNPQ
jgi:hypothetical protein